jgi:hypothetical protein
MKNSSLLSILLSGALLSPACNGIVEQPVAETQILVAPYVYGTFPGGAATRAIDLEDTGEEGNPHYHYNGFNGEPDKTVLPIGSTLWLTYRKALDGITDPDPANDADWEESNLRAYVVQNSAGYNALYPIASHTVTEDGHAYYVVDDMVDGEYRITNPLYLKDGLYQFRMVSPAAKISASDLRMRVDNGMYLYSNDERYEQTRSKVIEVVSNSQGVQNIVLNPMINQTARFKVTLKPGSNVNSLEMLSQGIEVSGLQNPETEDGNLAFQWSSLAVADTLKMKLADKYSRVSIKEFSVGEDGSITGHTGVLPTNAMSTTMVILVNVAVNGIPTQYLVPLYKMVLYHGHSYNLELEIGLDGDIRVMNWANQAWNGEVTFND